MALRLGMNVLAFDLHPYSAHLKLDFQGGIEIEIPVHTVSFTDVIQNSDFITLHTPFADKPILGEAEFAQMKTGVGIVNCSRGGTIDEGALVEALNSGKVGFAGLDVFDNEPTPLAAILQHPKISLTPHIGASTNEAQERIGTELANLIIEHLSK
jgi:D-3-phosphoglycerate dehydrogenase